MLSPPLRGPRTKPSQAPGREARSEEGVRHGGRRAGRSSPPHTPHSGIRLKPWLWSLKFNRLYCASSGGGNGASSASSCKPGVRAGRARTAGGWERGTMGPLAQPGRGDRAPRGGRSSPRSAPGSPHTTAGHLVSLWGSDGHPAPTPPPLSNALLPRSAPHADVTGALVCSCPATALEGFL